MKKEVCKNCKWFSKQNRHFESERDGDCRRYPPVIIKRTYAEISVFPEVWNSHFCGEFRPLKPNEKSL